MCYSMILPTNCIVLLIIYTCPLMIFNIQVMCGKKTYDVRERLN